ncbi:Sporulation and spore germination [Abditibacterium utsteinense]|uniref:Sporulation and spore germination n=1 Tax=Abditibacterium utsteinense TaxID=1960156 RepID=A0A2S8SQN1_9BACT|nr:Sporulation and spore germination [Abditibacterium utsteinense]
MASIALGAIFLASCQPKSDETGTTQTTPAPVKVIDTIYVPGKDDKLHAKKVSFPALDTQLKSGGNPIPALDEIIKLSPQWFPKGTRVEDVKENGGVITILMSPEFGDSKHWQKGEKLTELAVYSLVNTLAQGDKTVALTVEGKPVSTLGEFDASGALKAEPALNAAPETASESSPKDTPAASKATPAASNTAT